MISLLTWTFIRDLDVHSIMESSVLSFLVPNREKHVAFKKELARVMEHAEEQVPALETTPKKRGLRSQKVNGSASSAQSASSAGAVRRSTRRKVHSPESDDMGSFVSEPDTTYQPSEETKRAVEAMESDGAAADGDVVSAGESTALALFLTFLGGLGQLAAGTLGAEVTGPRE